MLLIAKNTGIISFKGINTRIKERIPHPKDGGIFMPALWRESDNIIPSGNIPTVSLFSVFSSRHHKRSIS